MTTQERVRAFIVEELRPPTGAEELTPDYPLIERRVIDSMGIFQIVTFLEREFGVEVADDELVAENFGTIGGIAHLVDSKRGPS